MSAQNLDKPGPRDALTRSPSAASTPSVFETVLDPPEAFLRELEADVEAAGGELPIDPEMEGAIGATMFDVAGSEDNTVTVLLSQGNLQQAPSQSLLRIKGRRDGRRYLGIVTAGPFAEPDSLRGDSPILVTVATRGGVYLPPYHGRVQVTILGEELADGTLTPPRLRPLPNSPVFALDDEESAQVLRAHGDIRLGLVVGYEEVTVGVPSGEKSVLPRHTAILGTTGGGKSTTVAGLVQQAQAAGMAVILLDVEGEYAHLHEPTSDPRMLKALGERGLEAIGVSPERMTLYHLVGRDTVNPHHPRLREFSLQFSRLSPYAAMEILDLSDGQQERFLKAYDVAKEVLRDLHIFPEKENAEQLRFAMELDEFERGYPKMTLSLLIDVVKACHAKADKSKDRDADKPKAKRGAKLPLGDDDEDEDSKSTTTVSSCDFSTPFLNTNDGRRALQTRLQTVNVPGNAISWRALWGKLGRLNRLNVFYTERKEDVRPLIYKSLLRPGEVSVIDLSDSGMSELNNIVIADLLHGVQMAQDEAYHKFEVARNDGENAPPPTRVLIIIEEAHEFLSAERVERMSHLFMQVAKIAKRGRKRWLGLAFVTQLPQHLPRQVFGLVNSYILHKITDPQVVGALKRTVSGIDESLWMRLPGLAPGQAIVSFPHMTRPLLVAIDPAPAKLRMTD